MLEKHVDNHTSCLFLVLLHLNISLTRWRPILGMSAGDILKKPEIQSEATMESDTCVSYCFLCPHIFPELLSSFFFVGMSGEHMQHGFRKLHLLLLSP